MATQAECARLIGISVRRFRELVDEGVIPRRPAGQYDFFEVVPTYCANLRQVAAGRGGDEAQANKATEEARRMTALADLAEMKAAEQRGRLVPVDQIADAVHGAVQMMKTSLLAIPAKAAARVGAKDTARAEQVIKDEVVEALAALAQVRVVRDA